MHSLGDPIYIYYLYNVIRGLISLFSPIFLAVYAMVE